MPAIFAPVTAPTMFLIIFISFRRDYPDFGIWLHRTARRAGGYQVDNLLCATVISATHGLQSYLLSKSGPKTVATKKMRACSLEQTRSW